jgi:GAF domain-containing protein
LGIHFFAGFPIISKGRVLGAIVCNGRSPRQLTEPEHRLLTSMADQIGPAIDNVNLFDEAKSKSAELERRNREVVDALERQTAVAEMLRAMAHTLSDLQSFFDTMIADTVRLTRATGGVIRLADNTGALRYVAHYHNGAHRLREVEKQPLPADENGAAMQAYRQQSPVQFSDVLEQPPPLGRPKSTATRTVLAVPLLQEGVSIGVIVVFLMIMAVLLAVVGGLGLMGTMSINVLERTREIGILRAIGASNGAVLRIVIVEGVLIGVISWAIGAVLALPLSVLLSNAVGEAFLQMPLDFVFSLSGLLIWLGVVVVLAALASFLPAWNAARVTVRAVLAYE